MKIDYVCLNRVKHLACRNVWPIGLGMLMLLTRGFPVNGQDCEPCPHDPPSPPSIGATWDPIEEHRGGNEGRIAIVVDRTLYENTEQVEGETVQAVINRYKNVLLAEHDVVVVTFSGDGSNDSAITLREDVLHEYWHGLESLKGAILVGNLPCLLYEEPCGDPPGSQECTFPVDMYFMDMDGHWWDSDHDGFYDSRDQATKHAEIWVSRIRVDNLRMILQPEGEEGEPLSEAAVVIRYFQRNILLRADVLHSSKPALTYLAPDSHGNCVDARETMSSAFAQIDEECDGATAGDYIERISTIVPPSYDYHYVRLQAHGCPWGHSIAHESVTSEDYLAANSNVIGFSLISCNTCDFTQENYLGGVAAFNPNAQTLVVHGYTYLVNGEGAREDIMWNLIGVGRSFGEAYLAQVNEQAGSPFALLGDGTLRVDPHEWDGEGFDDNWSVEMNWESDSLPDDGDAVQIGAAAGNPVAMNRGSQDDPEPVWSLALRDGADLVFESHRGLQLSGSLLAGSQTGSEITMDEGSMLRLANHTARISNLNLTMIDGAAERTTLDVAGKIRDCEIKAGDNCDILASEIRNSDLVFKAGSSLYADAIASSSLSGLDSSLDVTGVVSACDVTLGEYSELTADKINGSSFDIHPFSSVYVASGVAPFVGVDENWKLDGAVVQVDGISRLGGDWLLSDSEVAFENVIASQDVGVQIQLENGSRWKCETLLTRWEGGCLHSPFPGLSEHELAFCSVGNVFGGGTAVSESETDWLYLGENTCIREACSDSELLLLLRAELRIASDFTHEVVFRDWDSRNVDIKVQPIWGPTPWEDPDGRDEPDDKAEQAVELISPPFPDGLGPVIFLDAPCQGAFRDFILADWIHESPDDDKPLGVAMRDYYRNWGTSGSEGWLASARFRNIVIGRDRELYLYSPHGPIYLYGTFVMRDGANVYYDGVKYDACSPGIIPVAGSIVGDWNGDCAISNVEIAQLQAAIQGGPATYNSLMDVDCDGQLTVQVELAQVLANAVVQPSCTPPRAARSAERGGDPGITSWRESSEAEPFERYEDVPGLATWLRETLTEEQLEEFIIELDDAAARFAEEPIGEDMIELLYYLR